MAYLGAIPEKCKLSRIEQIQGNHLGERDEDGNAISQPRDLELPKIPQAFQSLVANFFNSGQAVQTGMGLAPLSWQEIQSFIEVNDLDLLYWEKQLLKKMSEAYCAESHKATDPKRPAPYTEQKDEDEIDHIAVAISIRDQIRLLRKQSN